MSFQLIASMMCAGSHNLQREVEALKVGGVDSRNIDMFKAMQDKRLELKSLITHRYALSEYKEAFSLMHERREMYCKVMFVV